MSMKNNFWAAALACATFCMTSHVSAKSLDEFVVCAVVTEEGCEKFQAYKEGKGFGNAVYGVAKDKMTEMKVEVSNIPGGPLRDAVVESTIDIFATAMAEKIIRTKIPKDCKATAAVLVQDVISKGGAPIAEALKWGYIGIVNAKAVIPLSNKRNCDDLRVTKVEGNSGGELTPKEAMFYVNTCMKMKDLTEMAEAVERANKLVEDAIGDCHS